MVFPKPRPTGVLALNEVNLAIGTGNQALPVTPPGMILKVDTPLAGEDIDIEALKDRRE